MSNCDCNDQHQHDLHDFRHTNHTHMDRAASDCDDQLPLIARVGRGLQGDSYRVDINRDDTDETYLEGFSFDEVSKTERSEWISENINGGELSYQYNLRPYSIPQTFTITFIYRRPGRPQWSWTTPAIPYVWDVDGDGEPDVDGVVGSGVGNLYIREGVNEPWIEKLIFPAGTTAEDYNSPLPEAVWSVNLTFGVGGDVNIPNLGDLAKVLGWTPEEIIDCINGTAPWLSGSENVKKYIDSQDANLHNKIYADLGDFINLPSAGGDITIKEYIDAALEEADQKTDDLKLYVNNFFKDILLKINPSTATISADGHISWPNTNKIPTGNVDVTSGGRTSASGLFSVSNASNNNNLNFA